MMADRAIQIGIAGWSYPDWQGIVYPRSCRDSLRHVARLVDFIEINSSFYRSPSVATVESWLHRTAESAIEFTAKLPRATTHEGQLERVAVEEYCRGFAPLADAGRLRMLLAQFSYRFEANPVNFEFLCKLKAAYEGLAPLALEVRHASWCEDGPLAWVAEQGFSLVHLDYPGGERGFDGRGTEIHGADGVAYMRLHGRNQSAWFDKQAGRDATYDYEYAPNEVEALKLRIDQIAENATRTRVVANNHFHGKAMKLVLELISWCTDSKVSVPGEMLGRYPDLRAIAERCQGELF